LEGTFVTAAGTGGVARNAAEQEARTQEAEPEGPAS
jgi:hypothetical protein